MAMTGPLVLPDSMVGATDRSITRKPCTPRTRSRVSYVIVGAGSAGCVLANRLSANPAHRVLLIGHRS